MSHNRSRGFSLVEIVVALSIVLVLIGLLTPWIISTTDESKLTRVKQDLDGLAESCRQYALTSNGNRLPRSFSELSDSGLNAPVAVYSIEPVDPWGIAYLYSINPTPLYTIFTVMCNTNSPAYGIFEEEELRRVVGRE